MERRAFLRNTLALAVGSTLYHKISGQTKDIRKPNFIFILTDDQGWADIARDADPSIPGSHHAIFNTPNMLRLSERSVNFSSGYSPACICTPTRRSIQFGMTPARIHGTEFVSRDFDPAGKPSIAQMIKRCDPAYICAHFGKWGSSMVGRKFDDPRGDPKNLGYDVSDGYTCNEHGGSESDVKHGLNTNDDPKRIFSITARGIEFMKERALARSPFYLQMSYYAIHRAAQARPATIAKCRGKGDARGGEFTMNLPPMMEDLDAGIGDLLNAVHDLGLEGNTYIFFGADNGGASPNTVDDGVTKPSKIDLEKAGLTARNAPLSEAKHSIREGGIRVPMMASGPGIVKNSWCRTPVVLSDLYATIHAVLGAPFSLPDHIDSADIRDVMFNGNKGVVARKKPGIVFHYPMYRQYPCSACRDGDLKVFVRWKPGSWEMEKIELYDMAKDVGEKNDIAATMPDKAKEMAMALAGYLKSVDAELPPIKKHGKGRSAGSDTRTDD